MGTRELGWLIEWDGHDGLYFLTVEVDENEVADFMWTKDSLEALRFCRKADAEKIAKRNGQSGYQVTEHEWVGGPE